MKNLVPGKLLFLFLLFPFAAYPQWVQTNGPNSANVLCILSLQNFLFIGTSGGVYRSSDNGTKWTSVNNVLIGKEVNAIIAKGDTLFVGTSAWAGTHGGIYRSTNYGESWTWILQDKYITSFAIKDNVILAGEQSWDILRSTDNGNNWVRVSNGLHDPGITSLLVIGKNIFAGTLSNGICISTDNGGNWSPINNGMNESTIWSIASSGNYIFAATYGGIYRSADNGGSWINVYDNNSVYYVSADSSKIFATVGDIGIIMSSDFGDTWYLKYSPLFDNEVSYLPLAINGNYIYCGSSEGFYISTDCGNEWSIKCDGLLNSFVTAIGISGNRIFSGSIYAGISFSTDDGKSWMQTLQDCSVSSIGSNGNNIFAGTQWPGICRSTNNGITWTPLTTDTNYIGAGALAISGNNIFAGGLANYGGGGVSLSSDNGQNWTPKNNGIDFLNVSSLLIYQDYIIAGTYDNSQGNDITNTSSKRKQFPRINNYKQLIRQTKTYNPINSSTLRGTMGGIYVSEDNGDNWIKFNDGLTSTNIISLSTCNSYIVAGTDSGIFILPPESPRWIPSLGPKNNNVTCFAVSGNNIFAGTYGNSFYGTVGIGIFLSKDYGSTWLPVNDSLQNLNILSMAINGDNLYAGTAGNGIWCRPISEMVTNIKNENNIEIKQYSLLQNYPNPFNPSTTIKYQIPKPGIVTLKVYDILGKEVDRLVNEFQQQGRYSVNFDASKLASGVYIYRIKSNDYVSSKKMMLIK